MTRQRKILVEDVSKTFASSEGEVEALREVELAVAEGEFLSIVGPSGCGKSTLLEIVAGLQSANEGRVLLDGAEVGKPGPDRAVVFQHYALFPWRTVVDNVAFPLEMAGMGKEERRSQAIERLRMVGLERFAKSHVWQLSGGMQQRVALARALACEPKVLLMDEPFSGADAITRELLQDQLRELHARTGLTILFVTHSVDEAIHLSERIVVMGIRPGRIVAGFEVAAGLDGRPEQVAELRDAIWDLLRREINPAGEPPAKRTEGTWRTPQQADTTSTRP